MALIVSLRASARALGFSSSAPNNHDRGPQQRIHVELPLTIEERLGFIKKR